MDLGLDALTSGDEFRPDDVDCLQYLFWEKGISLEEFNRLPIPYIIRMGQVYAWANKPKKKGSK